MSDTIIRRMTVHDIPTVATLEQDIYDSPWSMRVFYDELALENRRYFVVEDDTGILGYAGLLVVESDAHITTMAINRTARRQRLGTRMMMELAAAAIRLGADHITLEVRMSNDGAQRLYERFGFSSVGLRKNYYKDEDAMVMWANDISSVEYQARLLHMGDELKAAGHG